MDVRKELSITCCECPNCTGGKIGILSAAPLSLPSQELNINHMRRRKVVLINSSAASMSGFLSPTAISSGRRLKRLHKTASLVGLKYVFIYDCRWSRRGIASALIRYWQTRTHCCGHIVAHDVSWARKRAGHKINVVFPC